MKKGRERKRKKWGILCTPRFLFDLQEWGTASWGLGKVPAEDTEAGNKGS